MSRLSLSTSTGGFVIPLGKREILADGPTPPTPHSAHIRGSPEPPVPGARIFVSREDIQQWWDANEGWAVAADKLRKSMVKVKIADE